jgi:NAD(P)-dependent dehydrogenase (short-subunit alcohol dehydrogenase family)
MLFANGTPLTSTNVAGIMVPAPIPVQPGVSLEQTHEALASHDYSAWDDILTTNVRSIYYTVVTFIPLLGEAAKQGEGRGCATLIGSVGGIHWDKHIDTLNYSSAKA